MFEGQSADGGSRSPIRHHIRDMLQQMILDGRKPPGAKLVQQQLARSFGVAQGVVREALLELKACGLVEAVDNRGVFVSDLSPQRLLDSFDVREMNEGLAARLCCSRASRSELQELSRLAHKACACGLAGDQMGMATLDREFHSRLILLSGNSMLIRLAGNHRILGKIVQLTRNPEEVTAEHLAILAAIESGEPDEAELLMRRHIRVGKACLEKEFVQAKLVPDWLFKGDGEKD